MNANMDMRDKFFREVVVFIKNYIKPLYKKMFPELLDVYFETNPWYQIFVICDYKNGRKEAYLIDDTVETLPELFGSFTHKYNVGDIVLEDNVEYDEDLEEEY